MKPSEVVKKTRKYGNTKMETYEINGKLIKTNLGSYKYPWWNGNTIKKGCNCLWFERKTYEEMFDELVEKGYTYIRFVYRPTRIRGYSESYVIYC